MKWTATRLLCAALLLGCLAATASGRVFREGGVDPEERSSFLSEGAGEDAFGASNGAGQDRADFSSVDFGKMRERMQQIADAVKKMKADLLAHLNQLAEKGQPISQELLDKAKDLGVEVPPKLLELAKQAAEKAKQGVNAVKEAAEGAARTAVQIAVDQLVKEGRKIPPALMEAAERLGVKVPEGSRSERAGFTDQIQQSITELVKNALQRLVDAYVRSGKPVPPQLAEQARRFGVTLP